MTDIHPSETFKGKEPSWRDQINRKALDLSQKVLLSDDPTATFQSTVIDQSRPKSWYSGHWRDHVWGKFLDAYQDRRRLEGRDARRAAALAYFDASVYVLAQPDNPADFANCLGLFRYDMRRSRR